MFNLETEAAEASLGSQSLMFRMILTVKQPCDREEARLSRVE